MNERIEKLASEAIKAIPDHVDFDIPDAYIQKFAELIVQECALQCRHNDDMDRIEKHFGVA